MRLFVAVDLPEEAKRGLWHELTPLRRRWPELKWVRPELVHITLKFLGEQDDELVPKISEALSKVSFGQFEVSLSGLGTFGGRVLWVGISRGAEELAKLSKLVVRSLSFLRFPDDKPFRPHVTLARARRGQRVPSSGLPEARGFSFKVREFVLYKSVLSPQGPTYYPLSSFGLDPTRKNP